MKKLLGFPILFLGLIFSLNFAFANDCLELSFTDGDVCVSIEKDDNEYEVKIDSDSNSMLSCFGIFYGNFKDSTRTDSYTNESAIQGSCNGTFFYNGREESRALTLYIKMNNKLPNRNGRKSAAGFPIVYYDFDEGERDDDGSSYNGDIDNFYLTTDDSSPETNDRVDLTIRARDDDNNTVDDYRGTVEFKVYYRTSSSSSRRLTTSSTYYEIDDDYEDDYTFTSSDDGEAELDNFIKFKKEYDFKVRVEDEDDDDIYGERIFYVDDNGSSSNGFSSKDIDKVEGVYDARPSLIRKLENDYPKLKTNNTRQNMSDELYEEMENIIQGDDSIYDDFDEFYDGFLDRYSYTIRVR